MLMAFVHRIGIYERNNLAIYQMTFYPIYETLYPVRGVLESKLES